jgi:hypothetical protein
MGDGVSSSSNPQGQFQQEIVNQFQAIVDDFREAKNSKVEALRLLFSKLHDLQQSRSESLEQIPDDAIDPYLEQIEEHEKLLRDAEQDG